MTTIEIKEEGGCELYCVYIDGKKVLDYLNGEDTIDITAPFEDGSLDIRVNGDPI